MYHTTGVRRPIGTTGMHAFCSCGWVGPYRWRITAKMTVKAAVRDMRRHKHEATRLYPDPGPAPDPKHRDGRYR